MGLPGASITRTDLFQPSLQQAEPLDARRRAWRPRSQFWLAFLINPTAYLIIALENGRRLGVNRQRQVALACAGVLVILVRVSFLPGVVESYLTGTIAPSERLLRHAARALAVGLFLFGTWLQRTGDRVYVHRAEYGSLWRPGLVAAAVGGVIEAGLMMLVAGLAE